MRATTVLWDIDGTLLRSGPVAPLAFLDAVAEVTGVRPSPQGRDYGGRLDTEIAQMLHGAFENQRDIRDTAAAGRQGDGLAALDLVAQIQLGKRIANGRRNVVDARPRKCLTQTHHARIGHDEPRSIKQSYPALYGIE